MKPTQLLILLLFNAHFSIGQTIEPFQIEVIANAKRQSPSDFKKRSINFFEDDSFVVTKSCAGEFGGMIIFKDKKTSVEYSYPATCPVCMNKFNEKYIVTNSLAHMSGSTEILEISDPRNLKYGNNYYTRTGAIILLDSVGIMTLGTFPYNGELFHIVTDYKKTFIVQIINGKFVNIQILAEEELWTYEPQFIEANNHYILFFNNKKARGSHCRVFFKNKKAGYLDIHDNKIKFHKFK